jgi:hypothetical protein
MAERTVRTGVGSYVDVNGRNQFGMFGDIVDVHEDDLERFDRYNPAEVVEEIETFVVTEEEAATLPPAVIERADGEPVPTGADGLPILEGTAEYVAPVTEKPSRGTRK